MKHTKVLNLLAVPGTGKSSMMAGVNIPKDGDYA